MVGTRVKVDELVSCLSEPDAQLMYVADWKDEKPAYRDYLSLERDGTVKIESQPACETGKPEDVYYYRRLWWRLFAGFDVLWLRDWLAGAGKDLLQAVLDGWTMEWKDGKYVGVLDAQASRALEAIQEEFDSYTGPFHQLADEDYFQDGLSDEAEAVLNGEFIDEVVDDYLGGGDYTTQQSGDHIVYITRDRLRRLIEKRVEWLRCKMEEDE